MSVQAELLDRLVVELADALAPQVAAELASRMTPPVAVEPWRLLGVDEVAAMLGRSKRWVHGAIRERGLPFIRLDGGALAFEPEDVKVWARDRRVPAAEDNPLAGRLHEPRNPARREASNGRPRTAMQKVQG